MSESLPVSAHLRLEGVCARFEAAWNAAGSDGAAPRIEDYLNNGPEAERPARLRQLLLLDMHYRRRCGGRPTAEEYAARFPGEDAVIRDALAPPAPADAAPEPQPRWPTIPGYELLERVPGGGMGVVWKARQKGLGRVIALKMIRDVEIATPEDLRRFRDEYRTGGQLDHANIVPVYEVGEHHGHPFFTMKLIEGSSLEERIRQSPLPPREAARLLAAVARAVQHAHERHVIHRDLKPANILLDAAGEPHVIDFGLAKVAGGEPGRTVSGAILGTPSYMAPEQAAGRSKDVSAATDVYGLGAVLYGMLTGHPPFQAATVDETLAQVIAGAPAPPQWVNGAIDAELQTICLVCLAKNPADRYYATAGELADDLDRYLAGEPIRVRPANAWHQLSRALRRVGVLAPDFQPWSVVCLASAPVVLATQLAVQALFRARQPLWAVWAAFAFQWLVGLLLIWRYPGARGRLSYLAGTSVLQWLGTGAASLLLLPLTCPPGGPARAAEVLPWYPPLALLLGLTYFIQGRLYWGEHYLVSVLFLALAILLWLLPAWAPLIFGVCYAPYLVYHGLVFRRLGREMGRHTALPGRERTTGGSP
jgi:serine/threonine-protein kinase